MALPELFQRLVEEDGWAIVADDRHMWGHDCIIEKNNLRFSISETKDTGPQFSVRTAKGRRHWMHPCRLVQRMGQQANDEFEAFNLIAKDRTDAERKLSSYHFRKRFLEPVLILPAAPLLILCIVPFVRRPILEFLDWWTNGPVRRLVG